MIHRPRIELVTRGDDAGAGRSANAAIAGCHDRGTLRNASVMGCGPALADAADRFRTRPALCIGLHACLNSEWTHPRFGPVLSPSRVPSLVGPDGCFLPTPMDLHERRFDPEEAVAEVRAQLGRVRAAGLRPVYLDEHMGVGWLPGLRVRLIDLAERENLLLVEGRVPPLPPIPGAADDAETDPAQRLLDRLRAAPPGRHLLVTHPMLDDAEAAAWCGPEAPPGRTAAIRSGDRRLLEDPRLLRFFDGIRAAAVRYDEVF
ncbi:ChbG/HpnK family deacetylase [Phycisphaera mikurensis]|uniref:ChbG/HpnK family deacetylase n=1 Tax=Phycisphaera mikurensis (strain NBRC 102666 / KCTC 22515 / FYK2301M01) TaxID=1142394 RepID=I0ID55_PHYMF|nr:ChbG/HpnK family deacetylase [Phycisphaera mikurensis]MBB6442317.1 hypothetical protein [Phycisphaera mikurensis]BAM03193.1 hypothetical protein PSMK_10340 [Phycisphaera mikurensis NBRC 102666]